MFTKPKTRVSCDTLEPVDKIEISARRYNTPMTLPDQPEPAGPQSPDPSRKLQRTKILAPADKSEAPDPVTQDFAVGDQTGLSGHVLANRYRVLGSLGKGGMGEVYEAKDLELNIRIALKTILPKFSAHPGALERFKREITLARKVSHPNVCRIFDMGFHVEPNGNKICFLTMELLPGKTLAQVLEDKQRMTEYEALPLVSQMAEGLRAAHSQGIVHRDFKSANVMLVPQPSGSPLVKITDFGIARAVTGAADATQTLSALGSIAGTPAYMAPEQVEGAEITVQTDIYALGIVMYEILTGALPFTGPTPWGAAMQRLKVPPTPPRSRVAGIDARWESVILRCLEREPAARFASASDVVDALSSEKTVPKRPADLCRKSSLAKRVVISIGATAAIAIVSLGLLFHFRLGTNTVKSPSEQYGWLQRAYPTELAFPNPIVVAAQSGSNQLIIFSSSSEQAWGLDRQPQSPIQTPFLVAGQADCRSALWLIQDDHRRLTRWDIEKQRALDTVTVPEPFYSATCLDAKGEKWYLLAHSRGASKLVEFDAQEHRATRSIPLSETFLLAAANNSQRYVALLSNHSISIRTFDRLEEVFHQSASEVLLKQVPYGWSPSGRYFAFGIKQLEIYDADQKNFVATLNTAGWIQNIGWIDDRGLSVVDDRGRLYWTDNVAAGWKLRQDAPSESVYSAQWVPQILAWLVTDGKGKPFVWYYSTPDLLFDLAVSPLEIWSIAPDPTGEYVAVSGKDPRISIVDVKHRSVARTLDGHTDGVPFVRYDAYHHVISVGDDATIRVWDPKTGSLLQTVTGHKSLINAFAMSPDGRWLITVSSDQSVRVWSLPGLTLTKELLRTKDSGAAVSFLPGDEKHLLISDWGGNLYSFDGSAPGWQLRQQFQLGNEVVYMVCPGRDSWWAAVPQGAESGLWKIPADNLNAATRVTLAPANYCSTSDDGEWTATVSDRGIDIWSNASGAASSSYKYAIEPSSSVAIAKDRSMVFLGLDNGHLVAWPIAAQRPAANQSNSK